MLDRPDGHLTAEEALKTADTFLADEQAARAQAILWRFLEDRDHPAVWLKLSRAYRLLGDPIASRAILRNVILRVGDPHIMNIIAARIPYTKVIVMDNIKVVYVNIPKCGSSSLKDTVLLANKRELRGNTSHFHVRDFEKTIPFTDLDQAYRDFKRIAVIRHPRERLRSYFAKNIDEASSLVKEAGGKPTFYTLSTRPTYNEMLAKFRQYRNVFEDFRHHTDSLVGYLGQDRLRYTHVFNLKDIDQAMKLLNPGAEEMPKIHNMASKNTDHDAYNIDAEMEDKLIARFYSDEIKFYF